MADGPLLAHIQRWKCFTEREASEVVREMAEALNFLQKRGVAHRDLNLENNLGQEEDQVVSEDEGGWDQTGKNYGVIFNDAEDLVFVVT